MSIGPQKLTREEELELLTRAKAGDRTAIAEIVRMFDWIVTFHCRRHRTSHHYEDLRQQGIIGIIEAIRIFDPGRGCRFSTYAQFHVRNQLSTFRRNMCHPVRIPTVTRTFDSDRVRQAKAHAVRTAVYVDARGCIHDTEIVPHGLRAAASDPLLGERAGLAALVERLPSREREVVLRRMHGDSLKEIGVHFGLTRERIRQLEAQALNRLKEWAGLSLTW